MKSLYGCEIRPLLAIAAVAVLVSGGSANADFAFGAPTNLGPTLNSSARDEEPGASADGLSLYWCSLRAGGYGNYDLWMATRATTQDAWGAPANLGSTVNSSSHDFSPDISADGLSLYFGSDRPGGFGGYDIWVATRASRQDAWGKPVNLGPLVNTSGLEGCPAISDDGLELYFWSGRAGGYGDADIWVSRRATTENAWGVPANLGPVINGPTTELCCDITGDGRCLVFVSTRAGGYGGTYGDIWMATRRTKNDPWGSLMNPGPVVNSSTTDNGPFLSVDGSVLYFSSERPGGSGDADMWQVSVDPALDFNGDGIVDLDDLLAMIDCWGTDEPLCDIGPMPWGDGVVDKKDLAVLMSHWGEETALIAHWALDETEGGVASDSAGVNDGTLVGDPIWQPAGGKIGGAVQLDGLDDHVAAGFVCDPSKGSFSVFAWVQGGGPGQVVISQQGGVNWLMADPTTGALMTELQKGGRNSKALCSDAVIADGAWHRVGFTWDGSNRTLYVDGIAVAQDTQSGLTGSTTGLNIGARSTLVPGTFWQGLIDDVRIYDKAIKP